MGVTVTWRGVVKGITERQMSVVGIAMSKKILERVKEKTLIRQTKFAKRQKADVIS